VKNFKNLLLGLVLCVAGSADSDAATARPHQRQPLTDGWLLKSSVLVSEDGQLVSTVDYHPRDWLKTAVPCTVLGALVKNGVYPDPRIGLNCYQIPDASDEFNKAHDLAKFSYLPDKRNPWRDPYWYRKEFTLPKLPADRRVWLHFDCINYRAEVWLNGRQIADRDTMVGMFQRFDFDITAQARFGRNVLAVKMFPVDHPGTPDTQLIPFGKDRYFFKDNLRDVTMFIGIGYDCMPTVPDRSMGIIQDVWVDWTGPVAIRHPFVATELPLPETNRATLRISTELVNATDRPVEGLLRGRIAGTDVKFEQTVKLGPKETKEVAVAPRPVIHNPRLWWPRGYGEQPLYDLRLAFESGGATSDDKKVSFGVRQVTTRMHEHNGSHGRRVLINGRKIFCRGGYVQPEILFDWDADRIETEIRYYAEANLNLIYFEDIPNPPESLLDACDRLGVMLGQCFYSNGWQRPDLTTSREVDTNLLLRCTVDVIKRYRNHPSLVMYMAQNEYDTRREVYEPWRKYVIELDGTRFWIPSGAFPDGRSNSPEWIRPDLPAGMNDDNPRSYSWVEPVTFFDWVRNSGTWMFKIEAGSPSVPPMSSLVKFLPDLQKPCNRFAPDAVWAHHDACHYFKDYDDALRRLHGDAVSATDYAWKSHVLCADQHRAMFEAVNHRMWDITSGFTQWKINACWPSVEWQAFDWYLKPMVSWFYIKRAGEPLHVQLNLPERTVSVVNTRLPAQSDLVVRAKVFDLRAKLLWEHDAKLNVSADAFQEPFVVPEPPDATPVYFVKLELTDSQGRLVSDNFYWLRAKDVKDYKTLQSLPMTKLTSTCKIETRGAEKLARVKVTNPTRQIAFLVQLALIDGHRGAEIMPIFWDDNYFSLLPGESREITARFAAKDAGQGDTSLEVGGWNVETAYECPSLTVSRKEVKAGEPFAVTARIANTFLDGSRVTLLVDGQPAAAKWAWARDNRKDEIAFDVSVSKPGDHSVAVGNQSVTVKVHPQQ
jgi:hypothetical protein